MALNYTPEEPQPVEINGLWVYPSHSPAAPVEFQLENAEEKQVNSEDLVKKPRIRVLSEKLIIGASNTMQES